MGNKLHSDQEIRELVALVNSIPGWYAHENTSVTNQTITAYQNVTKGNRYVYFDLRGYGHYGSMVSCRGRRGFSQKGRLNYNPSDMAAVITAKLAEGK